VPARMCVFFALTLASMARSAFSICNHSLILAKSSNCPSPVWATHIVPLLAAPSMVMISVGANKGYNVNSFLQRYSRGWTTSNAQWWTYLKFREDKKKNHALMEDKIRALCGSCSHCEEKVMVSYGQADVQVMAVEPLTPNVRILESAFSHFAVPGHVIHAAGGDTVGSTFEPGALNSTVRGGQAGDVAKTTKLVPMITVDSLVQKYSIPSISLIRINTEGHDPAVLRGASWVLGHKMASVVEFEYHFKGMWTRTKLSAVMSQMKEYGYDCFWQSNAGWLSPFFAQCDHEFHSLWNSNSGIHNVVCAHDHRILRTFSMLVPRGLRNVTRGLRNVTRGLRNVTRGGLRSSR